MHKTQKSSILSVAVLAAAFAIPALSAQADIVKDAAATCGSRLMFSPDRTFENATSLDQIDRIYGCVDSYLKGLPEYNPSVTTLTADQQFIASVRQIDMARANGQLTAAQAQAQMQAAVAARKG